MPSPRLRAAAMASTAPAAPSMCPVMDLVLEMCTSAAALPKAFLTARVSTRSFNGVEVPWALRYTVSPPVYSASSMASRRAAEAPSASGWGAVTWYASQVLP